MSLWKVSQGWLYTTARLEKSPSSQPSSAKGRHKMANWVSQPTYKSTQGKQGNEWKNQLYL
jgi:hypothetical protein